MGRSNLLKIIAIILTIGVLVFFFVSGFKKSSDVVNDKVDLLTIELVSDYIENNIYSLSSREAVLGGSFYIESIRVLSVDTGVVDFEDGHMSYRAEFSFTIKNGRVSIDNFNILDDNKEKVNFSKTGNLILKNDNWSLVYEENEIPLSVFLRFNDISRCIENNEVINCSEDILVNGDKVSIDGFNESGNVLIYNLKFLFEREAMDTMDGLNSI